MSKRLDQILVVDVEATCWEFTPPKGEESEIIEIGLARYDIGSREVISSESILVKPVRSKVSPFCTRLTTLTQEQVDKGMSFEEACRYLTLIGKKTLWASYGDYDRNQFQRQCDSFRVRYPFNTSHLNIKTLAALALDLTHEVGMEEALKQFGLPLIGTHHRGIDDAKNIASILDVLIDRLRLGGK